MEMEEKGSKGQLAKMLQLFKGGSDAEARGGFVFGGYWIFFIFLFLILFMFI
jgi:hypothetical protein